MIVVVFSISANANASKYPEISLKFRQKHQSEREESGAVQGCVNPVDLEKCWKLQISISLQKSASIQPRTSPFKSIFRYFGRPCNVNSVYYNVTIYNYILYPEFVTQRTCCSYIPGSHCSGTSSQGRRGSSSQDLERAAFRSRGAAPSPQATILRSSFFRSICTKKRSFLINSRIESTRRICFNGFQKASDRLQHYF